MSNPYYNPEEFGLTIITDFETEEPCWSFSTVVVWRDEDNHYWLGYDSGCSCPSPFEDFTRESLDGPYNFHEAIREMEKHVENSYDKDYANEEFARAVDTLISTRKA